MSLTLETEELTGPRTFSAITRRRTVRIKDMESSCMNREEEHGDTNHSGVNLLQAHLQTDFFYYDL